MNTHLDKTVERKPRAEPDAVAQQHAYGSPLDAANDSPPAQRLRAIQHMANGSARVRQLAAIRDMANDSRAAHRHAGGVVQRASDSDDDWETLANTDEKEGKAEIDPLEMLPSNEYPESQNISLLQTDFSPGASSSNSRLDSSDVKAPHKEEGESEQNNNIISLVDLDEPEDINLQGWLTKEHWKGLLEGQNSDRYRKTQIAKYWENYAPKREKKTPPRPINEIIDSVGPELLQELEIAGDAAPNQRLKLYRTMPKSEAAAILQWFGNRKGEVEGYIRDVGQASPDFTKMLKDKYDPGIMPVTGHIGDRSQAETYRSSANAVLEFTLKPGAQLVLFNPKYLAIARTGKGATSILAEFEKMQTEKIFPKGSDSEGMLSGYVGMKSEARGDFSLTMGTSEATHLLFQLFVESVREV